MTGRTSPRTLDHIQMVQKKSPFASECHIENVLVILVVVVAHVLVQHTHNAPTVANRALDFIGKILLGASSFDSTFPFSVIDI